MQFTLATTALFITAALSAPLTTRSPTFPVINFSVTNDLTGLSAAGQTLANGTPLPFSYFLGTPIAKDGRVIATSAQLTAIVANALCVIKNAEGDVIGLLNEQRTFADLDGVQDKAVETDVTDFVIICEI